MDIGAIVAATFSAWIGAFIAAAVAVVVVAAVLGVINGIAFASYGRIHVAIAVLVAVLVPVLGPLILAIVAVVREVGRARLEGRPMRSVLGWSVRGVPRPWRVAALVPPALGLIGLVVVLFVPAVQLRPLASFPVTISLTAIPNGVVVTIVSALVVLLTGSLAFRRASRLGAIAAGAIGAVWASAGAIVLLLAGPVFDTAARLGSVADSQYGRVGLEWLRDLVPSMGDMVAAAAETLTARLGPAPWIALVTGVILEIWALTEVIAAMRAAVRVPEQSAVAVAVEPRPSDGGPTAPEAFTW